MLLGLAAGYVYGIVMLMRYSPDAERDKALYPLFVGQGLSAGGLAAVGAWGLLYGPGVGAICAIPCVAGLILAYRRSARENLGRGVWWAALVLHALIFAGVIAFARWTKWPFV